MQAAGVPVEHESRLRVRVFELNAFGELRTTALLHFLQQAASDAVAAVGFGEDWFVANRKVWTIRRTRVEVARPAVYGDEVLVRTRVADIRRVRSQREYRLLRASDGAPIAEAFSDWVFVDLERLRPVQPPEEMKAALLPAGGSAVERALLEIGEPPPNAFATHRRVRLADLDSFAVVNNAHYAGYVEDDLWSALAERGWAVDPHGRDGHPVLALLDIEYFEATGLCDELAGRVWVPEAAGDRFVSEHELRRAGRLALQARAEWRWSRGDIPEGLSAALNSLAPPAP